MPIQISGTGEGTVTAYKGGQGLSTIVDTNVNPMLQDFLKQEGEAATRRRDLITKRLTELTQPDAQEYWFVDKPYFDELGQSTMAKGIDMLSQGESIFDEFSPEYYKWQGQKADADNLRKLSLQQQDYFDSAAKAFDPKVHDPQSMADIQAWATTPFEERTKSGPPPPLRRRGWELETNFFDPVVTSINQGIGTALSKGDYKRMEEYRTQAVGDLGKVRDDLLAQGQDPQMVQIAYDRALAGINNPLMDLSAEQERNLRAWKLRMDQAGIDADNARTYGRAVYIQGTNAQDPTMLGAYLGATFAGRKIISADYDQQKDSNAPGGFRNYIAFTLEATEEKKPDPFGQVKTDAPEGDATAAAAPLPPPNLPSGAIYDEASNRYFLPLDNDASFFTLNGVLDTSPTVGGHHVDAMSLVTNGADEGTWQITPTLAQYKTIRLRGGAPNTYQVMKLSKEMTQVGTTVEQKQAVRDEIMADLTSQMVPWDDAVRIVQEIINFQGGAKLTVAEQNKYQRK